MKMNEKMNEMETMEKGIEYKIVGEVLIIAAVMMYILSVFGFLVLPFNENMNLFIFGVFISIATGLVIYGGFQLSYYQKINEEQKSKYGEAIEPDDMGRVDESSKSINKSINKKRKESVGTIFSMIATITYLYIGFYHGLWHPGWIIFLIIPVANSLYDLLRIRERY